MAKGQKNSTDTRRETARSARPARPAPRPPGGPESGARRSVAERRESASQARGESMPERSARARSPQSSQMLCLVPCQTQVQVCGLQVDRTVSRRVDGLKELPHLSGPVPEELRNSRTRTWEIAADFRDGQAGPSYLALRGKGSEAPTPLQAAFRLY